MLQGQRSVSGLLPGEYSSIPAGNPAEHYDIHERVAHKPVFSVQSTGHFPGDIKPGENGLAFGVVLKPSVLIVERGINQHGRLRDIDSQAVVDLPFPDKSSPHPAFAVEDIEHGGIEPDPYLCGGSGDAFAIQAFLDETCRFHVPGLALIDEFLAVDVENIGPLRAEPLGNQPPFDLLREDHAGGVILNGMQKRQRHSCPVAQDNAIGSGAVMIGGHEALDVEPAGSAGGQNYGLCLSNKVLLRLHVI